MRHTVTLTKVISETVTVDLQLSREQILKMHKNDIAELVEELADERLITYETEATYLEIESELYPVIYL